MLTGSSEAVLSFEPPSHAKPDQNVALWIEMPITFRAR